MRMMMMMMTMKGYLSSLSTQASWYSWTQWMELNRVILRMSSGRAASSGHANRGSTIGTMFLAQSRAQRISLWTQSSAAEAGSQHRSRAPGLRMSRKCLAFSMFW